MTDKKKRICLACGRVIAHPTPTQKYHLTPKCQRAHNAARIKKWRDSKKPQAVKLADKNVVDNA